MSTAYLAINPLGLMPAFEHMAKSSSSPRSSASTSRTSTLRRRSSPVYTDILAEPAHQAPRGAKRRMHVMDTSGALAGRSRQATDIADRENPGCCWSQTVGPGARVTSVEVPSFEAAASFSELRMPGHWLRIVQVCAAPVLRHQLFAPKSASAIERSDRACLSAPRVTRL